MMARQRRLHKRAAYGPWSSWRASVAAACAASAAAASWARRTRSARALRRPAATPGRPAASWLLLDLRRV
jgi:hypothetical protein